METAKPTLGSTRPSSHGYVGVVAVNDEMTTLHAVAVVIATTAAQLHHGQGGIIWVRATVCRKSTGFVRTTLKTV